MPKKTDDAPIVRDEAASMDAEGNKRAAEDKAASEASRTEVEKADDAGRAASERGPLGSAADAMTTMTKEEARTLADRPSRSPNLSAPDADKAE